MGNIDVRRFDVIYSDGACKGNPGPGGWGALVLLRGESVYELGGSEPDSTNNKMELTAVVRALESIPETEVPHGRDLLIVSDSQYVILGIEKWTAGWIRRGWRTSTGDAVQNKDRWVELLEALELVKRRYKSVGWRHVLGHMGCPGNERVDHIASSFAQLDGDSLYEGTYQDYGIDLSVIPEVSIESRAHKKSKSKKAHSYVSLVGGVFEVHKTWAECEARVKGRSGVKYRKCLTLEEQELLRREWT